MALIRGNMKKIIIFLAFLISTLSIKATTYYITTSGSNGNNGTSIGTAWATWQYGMTHIVAGDVLYIRAGTYTVMYNSLYGVDLNPGSGRGNNGTANNHITVSAYPGDANPELDCTGLTGSAEHDGIVIQNLQYWDFVKLTITNTKARGSGEPAPGWTLSDCSYITLNQCILHDNDNGFISYWGNEVHYINCDSHHNGETALYYGNNGFYGCVKNGGTTYWYGCRSYLNGQDGFDSFAGNGGDGYLYWDRCWAFSNGTWYGSASGFKEGLSGVPATTYSPMRITTNCISAYNPCGYDESQDPGVEKHAYSYSHAIYNCISYGNDVAFAFDVGAGVVGGDVNHPDIIRNNISYNDGYVSYIGFGANTVSDNSWQIRTPVTGDFQNTDVSQLSASRNSDGSLPPITFMHLTSAATSFIGHGYDLGGAPYLYDGDGVAWAGTYDVGAFKYGGTPSITIPTVTTTAITSITSSSAVSGGNVTNDGGASVTARGVCWGVSANPTTASYHTTDGSGSGVFVSSITGLSTATTYHVRAYASNSAGTAYGADVQFTTSGIITTIPIIHNGSPVTSGGKLLIIIR